MEILGPKRKGVIGGLRKLHKELHDLCCRRSIIWVIKSRIRRWAEHVARMEGNREEQDFGEETWGEETTWKR